jgi:surface-anchored protein
VAYYQVTEFGAPVVSLNSRDGITGADAVTVAAGSHAHRNWAFSAPGVYRITLQAAGTLSAGPEVVSAPTTFLFEVLAPSFFAGGEIDFELIFEEGEWAFALLDEATERELSAEDAVLVVSSAARQTIPADPAFAFLGVAGGNTYVLPQEETEGVLFLGLAADEIAPGVLSGNSVRLELVAATGPGHFALYSVNSFGAPAVFMDTADGLGSADVFPMEAGAHTHANWAFSRPGSYALTFRASGIPAGASEPVLSAPVTLRFLVSGESTGQAPSLNASLANEGRQLVLSWNGTTGAVYQLQARGTVGAGEWLNEGVPITGTDGLQTVTADVGSERLRVFRLIQTQL